MTTSIATNPTEGTSKIAPAHLVGGVGGLVFVAAVVMQNIIRSSAPMVDDGTAEVIAYYDANYGATVAAVALFAVAGVAIALFTAGLVTRLLSTAGRTPALAGAVGATAMLATFSMTVASEVAVSAYIRQGSPDAGAVDSLWLLHNAFFALVGVGLAVALAGFSAGAAAAGLISPRWKPVGLIAALALAVSAAATPASVEGSPIMVLGLLGFLTWLVFVATTSVRLVRSGS